MKREIHPVVWIVGVVIALIIIMTFYSCWQSGKVVKDAVIESKIGSLQIKDSSQVAGFNAVNRTVDSLTAELKAQSGHVDTIVRKVARIVRDTLTNTVIRIDSVFKDSIFASLPDSQKVEVLRLAAERQSRTCSILATTCQAAKDSARAVFVTKDSLIDLWHQRYDNKPRRRCGIGGTVGAIGGFSSTMQPIGGFGASVGYTCNF